MAHIIDCYYISIIPKSICSTLNSGGKLTGEIAKVCQCVCTSPNWIINLISRFSLFAVFYFNKQKHCHSKAYENPPKFIKLESLAFSSAAA